ncbi:hypothetical protein NBRC116584_30480 [Hydrogenophaga sp. 5NK40-0174]
MKLLQIASAKADSEVDKNEWKWEWEWEWAEDIRGLRTARHSRAHKAPLHTRSFALKRDVRIDLDQARWSTR